MISFKKRFSHIILIVAVLGGIFLIYTINANRPKSVETLSVLAMEQEYTETIQVDEGEKPGVWLLGDPADGRYGEIYSNVRQFCEDVHLTLAGEGHLDAGRVKEGDLVIFCHASISRYADPAELEEFIADGGRVVLAAGFAEEEGDSRLRAVLGIRQISEGEDCHELVFEKPLLPIQPEEACHYDKDSASSRIEVSTDASVYVRDEQEDIPVLYTYAWREGSVCLINGVFLADVRCMGLLTGAIGALLPDFIYPVFGVKAVFLDNFPMLTSADDKLCNRIYGYSAEGFFRDVVWPVFQGISLRTNTMYTSSMLAEASSAEDFKRADDAILTTICKSALQFGGELVYAVNCPEDGKVVLNEDFLDRFAESFPGYTVQGLALQTDNFSPEMLDVPGADIRSVRGMLGSRDTRLSLEDERSVFPAATVGNSMEDGNFFAICSVLGAYGMVSHVFEVGMLIDEDESTTAWDLERLQLSSFESEVLSRVPWLESRTLTQTGNDVRSYQDTDYGWTKNGSRVEFNCSGCAKDQAFFYHTDSRISGAEGLTYQDVGNGYYLLRVQENRGIITLEEEK